MYFEIKVQGRTKQELAKRVADNEKRGFIVARYYEYEVEGGYFDNSKYKTAEGINRRQKVYSANKFYGAVMRRKNQVQEKVAQ